MTSRCKMFSCFCRRKSSQSNIVNPIQWKDCKPFVPPISSGQVIKVYDGDTLTVAAQLPYPESPIYRFTVRLMGIDSPEMKGKTEEERIEAHKAQKALEDLVLHKTVRLENREQEKYGRLLADVYVDKIHINQWLLDNKYAKVYNGGTKEAFVPSKTVYPSKLQSKNKFNGDDNE